MTWEYDETTGTLRSEPAERSKEVLPTVQYRVWATFDWTHYYPVSLAFNKHSDALFWAADLNAGDWRVDEETCD